VPQGRTRAMHGYNGVHQWHTKDYPRVRRAYTGGSPGVGEVEGTAGLVLLTMVQDQLALKMRPEERVILF